MSWLTAWRYVEMREILVGEDVLHLDAVGLAEGALEERRRHLEADEAVIRLRQIGAGRGLHDVERELDDDVRRLGDST